MQPGHIVGVPSLQPWKTNENLCQLESGLNSYSYGPLTYAFKDLKGSLFVILYIYTLSFKKVDESGIVEIARGI